jgi:two-component system, NtrC family, response regulator PilR
MMAKSIKDAIRILVVDDEPDLRTLYELTLVREGYRVQTAASVGEALQCLTNQRFDVLITDMRLPDGLGIALIQHLRDHQRSERCIVITAYGSAENAVQSLQAGAFDYLTKPVHLPQFRQVIQAAALHSNQISKADRPQATSTRAGQAALDRIVGHSNAMRLIKDSIAKVACSMAPVMVRGESGTGKELVAQALHACSHRSNGPMVAVNCSAIPENLLESEFFGVKKGAYTGATQDRTGFFQAAQGGTLFLDEIGDLPLAMQSKLLRAIQERSVRAVGDTQEEATDVRIVSATHKNLIAEIAAGNFRQDLFYRLNVIELHLPALRERPEDLPALSAALLQRICQESCLPVPTLSQTFLSELALHPLPGNVRELENLLHRSLALGNGTPLLLSLATHESPAMPLSLPRFEAAPESAHHAQLGQSGQPNLPDTPLPRDLQNHLDQLEREMLVRALQETGYNRTAAAARLGLSLRQMRYRIERLNIDLPS